MKIRTRITCSTIGSALGVAVLISSLFTPAVWAADPPPLWAADPAAVKLVKAGKNCPHCNLSGADLSGLMAQGRDLSDADLSNAKLYKADLSKAILTGAILSNTILTGAKLKGAQGANLSVAVTDGSTLCPNGAKGPCSNSSASSASSTPALPSPSKP
jgi:uncharacterized protein YjbI with pentapeptide repeats